MKQVIGIGTTANDGTGDPIRTAFDKVNDNFTELYTRQSPVSGMLFSDVIAAVKYFQINEIAGAGLVYIDQIIAGTLAGGHYTYTITVRYTGSLSSAGSIAMRYTTSAPTEPKTGLELIELSEYDGSGFYGYMIINWSALTLGFDYQMPYWADGGLFSVVSMPQRFNIKDGNVEEITTTGTSGLDGSKDLYIIDPAADITETIAAVASVVGEINLKNISENKCDFTFASTETVDGHSGGFRLEANTSLSLRPYDGNFIITRGAWVEIAAV
jgi:hypothetical protein